MEPTRVADLTVDELLMLLRRAVREVLVEERASQQSEASALTLHSQAALLDIPPLSVGKWPEGLQLLSRDEYYGDDGR